MLYSLHKLWAHFYLFVRQYVLGEKIKYHIIKKLKEFPYRNYDRQFSKHYNYFALV